MRREVFDRMVAWKDRPTGKRKPLLLEGARQTGKTWLARELGHREFEELVEVNFEDDEQMLRLFEDDFDVERILTTLRLSSGKRIEPGKTLIFFDEIQQARRGLLALKYFFDKVPDYHVVAAGSLLGVIDHKDDSFPVGKVDFLAVHPLSFEEFLWAVGKEGLAEMMRKQDWAAVNTFADKYIGLLRSYFFVGGMPEAVLTYVEEGDFNAVREVHKNLLKSYEHDFSKHPPKEIVKRMELLWKSIPSQLARENRKFVYTAIRESARAREFETAIQWLCDAGMAHKVTRVNAGELPLRGFETPEAFKLYVLDVGLHGAMSGLDARSLLSGNDFFEQYKGALTEQFVLQELCRMKGTEIYYWTPDEGKAEVDFVIQQNGLVIPIEVKAEQNLKAKSLGEFVKKYAPQRVIRTSLAPYSRGAAVTDLPLFAVGILPELR